MSTQRTFLHPSVHTQSEVKGTESLPRLPMMLLKAVPTIARRKGPSQEPNDIEFCYHADPIDSEHLAKYHAMFQGFKSEIPLTYLYLLAQRAHLAAMLDERFPWPILGMVHVANEMLLKAPILATKPFEIRVHIMMPERAVTRKRIRPIYHVDFIQEGALRVSCISTYQVGVGESQPSKRSREISPLDVTHYKKPSLWLLSSELGRSYALLSGDYNPIHLHPWLSRWFGFERPIIHGMYSVAYAQAELERNLSASVTRLAIMFRKPLILPAQAALNYKIDQEGSGHLIISDALGKYAFLDGDFHYDMKSAPNLGEETQ